MVPTAYEGSENYIFISYAHADRDEVYKVLNELEKNGYRFWYDDGIAPGSEWAEDIARHLSRSAAVMAFITENSVKSQNCRREITYALSKEKPFVSVVLEETEMTEGLEMQLSAQQSVIRHNYGNWDRFIDKLLSCPDIDACKEPEPKVSEPIEPVVAATAAGSAAIEAETKAEAVPEATAVPAETKEKAADEKGDTSSKKAAAKKSPATGGDTKKKSGKRLILIGIAAAALILIALTVIHPGSVKTSWGESFKKDTWWVTASEVTVEQSDIEKLAKLTSMHSVTFENCDLSGCDLAMLVADKPDLDTVELYNCTGVDDYSFLEGLTLNTLSITNAPEFTDISGLDMTEMRYLNISGTGVTSADAVSAAENLTELYCSNCKIGNISKITALGIEKLGLSGCGITDMSAFKNLTRLTALYIGNNPGLESMDWLNSQNYGTLEVIHLNGTGLDASDLEFVNKCSNLTTLVVDGIALDDLSICAGKSELKWLSAAGCGIKDISALKDCTKLKDVFLSFNDISSIDGLGSLSESYIVLDLAFNKLSDVSALPLVTYDAVFLTGNEKGLAASVPKDLYAGILTVDWYDDITKAPFAGSGKVTRVFITGTPDSQKLNVEDSVKSLYVNLVTMDELYLDLLPNDNLGASLGINFSSEAELYKAR